MKIIRATTVPMTLDVFCRGLLKKLGEKYEVVARNGTSPHGRILSLYIV